MPSTAAEAAEIVVIMQMPCLTASVRIWFSFWRGTVPCGVLMMRETLLFLIRSITLGRPSLRRQTFFTLIPFSLKILPVPAVASMPKPS